MKIQRLNYRSVGFAILLLAALFAAKPQTACAQKSQVENKLSRYELSVDLVPIIDQGQFGKIYFKINDYKEDLLTGAYRFGISKGTYWYDKLDRTDVPNNVYITPDKFSNFETNFYIGYEKYKQFGPFQTYYGIDLIGWYFRRQNTPQYTDDQRSMTLGFCPFLGVKHFLYKKTISIGWEFGWENGINSIKSLNSLEGSKNTSFHSDIRLPYSFTINYHL